MHMFRMFFWGGMLSACTFLFFPILVHAQADAAATVATTAGMSTASILDIIGTIINTILGLLGVVFLVLVLYAGFLWMTAGGDDKQVDKARKILINATVGLVLMLSAYAITTFVINLITEGTGTNTGNNSSGRVSIERLSGSLGSGALRDHYPERNATDVPRNARIMVTFADAMDPASLTAETVSVYKTADGIESALSGGALTITSSEDLKTFIFDPVEYLGSSTASVSYTVFLSPNIRDANGDAVFVDANNDGYEWSFETGTTLDLVPPRVVSVIPTAGGAYARNISVQITFSEAIDPLSATGTRTSGGGFDNIRTVGASGSPLAGTYTLTNGYTTVVFTSAETCGTNSCGDTLYCLPPSDAITVTAYSATPGVNPPQVDVYPYDGIADISANALDANGDGTAGDDYAWSFSTTNSIYLEGPEIVSITPNIREENVPLDKTISILFNDPVLVSTISSDTIALTNTEATSGDAHELWYRFSTTFLDAAGAEVTNTTTPAEQTLVEIDHGTFLESINGMTYLYGITAGDGVQNTYQNCFAPAEGPSQDGGACGAAPYCCNGQASSTACTLF